MIKKAPALLGDELLSEGVFSRLSGAKSASISNDRPTDKGRARPEPKSWISGGLSDRGFGRRICLISLGDRDTTSHCNESFGEIGRSKVGFSRVNPSESRFHRLKWGIPDDTNVPKPTESEPQEDFA